MDSAVRRARLIRALGASNIECKKKMKTRLELFMLLAALAFTYFGCAMNKNNSELKVGGLYSVNDSEGTYRIAKVLALDEDAVHVRLYKNKFPSRPQTVDPSTLSLGSIDDKDGFGMGHLPLSREGFANWQPVFISQTSVSEEELEGYRMWKEAGGGIWQ
jgi:hypothetical protein